MDDGIWRWALTERVDEARYLVAEDADHHRPIMRLFYEQHEAHRYFLAAEELHLALDTS